MHLQNLKLLRPTIPEKMHLQENTLFDLQKLLIGNKKCDNGDEDDGDMFPMCRPYFAGDTKSIGEMASLSHKKANIAFALA